MSHLERRVREKEDLRARLLAAALELAIADSWQAVTMRKIAASVAYTTSVVYEHFASKEALLQALADQGFKQLYAQLKEAVAAEQDPKNQLRQLSLMNWEFASRNQVWYQLMFTLDRTSLSSAHSGFALIQDVFQRLTGKSELELRPIMLNWVCLREGCIQQLLRRPATGDVHAGEPAPSRLYLDFMERFITSITRSR